MRAPMLIIQIRLDLAMNHRWGKDTGCGHNGEVGLGGSRTSASSLIRNIIAPQVPEFLVELRVRGQHELRMIVSCVMATYRCGAGM